MIKLEEIQDAIEHCDEIINKHEVCDSCVKDHQKLKEILEYAYGKKVQEEKTDIFGYTKSDYENGMPYGMFYNQVIER